MKKDIKETKVYKDYMKAFEDCNKALKKQRESEKDLEKAHKNFIRASLKHDKDFEKYKESMKKSAKLFQTLAGIKGSGFFSEGVIKK